MDITTFVGFFKTSAVIWLLFILYMENLLHYIWKYKLYPSGGLSTTDGEPLEVINPGEHNTDAGPDFFNAKLRIGETLWVGNVEIHNQSSDWYAHKHETNRAYDNVILHVVQEENRPVFLSDGKKVPTLLLQIPEQVKDNYSELLAVLDYPRCHRIISSLPRLSVHSYLSALQTERLSQKAERIEELRLKNELNWEDAFFATLARNFGFGTNGEAFQLWASRIPLRAVGKHRDDLFQVEAIFFGQAGLLSREEEGDEYYNRLKREYAFLSHKFGLVPMDASIWRFMRMRPSNFPNIRLAQLAYLYHNGAGLLSRILECDRLDDVLSLFDVVTSVYWETHYSFSRVSAKRVKRLSLQSKYLLIVNTVSPFFFAYGKYKGDEALCQRAIRFMEELKAEDNHIIRTWNQCGLQVKNAADSQALIQLKREYCDKYLCLRCRFGYEYLKQRRQ